jgi:hypothetical protein
MIKYIAANNLKEDVDFRIITYFSLSEDFDMNIIDVSIQNPLDGYVITMFDTDTVKAFYGVLNHLDTKLLEGLGLGAVELLRGEFSGYKSLYNLDNSQDEFSLLDERVKIAIYFQLTQPNLDNKELEKLLIQEESWIRLLLLDHHDYIINRLQEIYKTKKVGKIFHFPSK